MSLQEIMTAVRQHVGKPGKYIYHSGESFPLNNITFYGEIVATYNLITNELKYI